MKIRNAVTTALFGVVLTLTAPGSAVAGTLPQHYQVIDIGAYSYVTAIADDNTVIGVLDVPGDTFGSQPARLWPTRAFLEPRSDLGQTAYVTAIGADGLIVGYRGLLTPHGALWGPEGAIVDLGTLGPASLYSGASALTRNLIVGHCVRPEAPVDFGIPCFWRLTHGQPGPAQPLPLLGGTRGFATSVNATGMICGAAQTANGIDHATCWVHERPVDLTPASPIASWASGVTRQGLVVGAATFTPTRPYAQHAFSWTRHTGVRDLGTLPGDRESMLLAVTDEARPVAVGWSATDASDRQHMRAVRMRLTTQGTGTLEDLNAFTQRPDVHLEEATVINRHGWIGAHATGFQDGRSHGVLLIPADVVAKDHADDDDDDDDDDNDE